MPALGGGGGWLSMSVACATVSGDGDVCSLKN